MAISNNPLVSAVESAKRSGFLYGQLQVTGAYVVLTKGVGKTPFAEGQHDLKDRRTEITFTLNPIEETGYTQLVTRSTLAESAEFSKIVWPSLEHGCGQKDLLNLDSKFAKIELVKNGRKWADRTTGEEKEGTIFKFHAIYGDQDACVAAYLADGNLSRTSTEAPQTDAAMDIDMSQGAGADDPVERETAKRFLPALIKQANGNKDTLAQTLKSTPIICKYFDIASPEVTMLMAV